MAQKPNSVCCYVEDAAGDKFLFTLAGLDCEAGFRKHARWWIRYATRPNAYKDTDASGRPIRHPAKPCRIVVERYYDKSSA